MMSAGLPISRPYNLNRLGQAGDTVDIATSDDERAALAQFTGVPRVDAFQGQVDLKKLAPNRFQLDFRLDAEDLPLEDDVPEEISSLHYDLAAPLVEELVLAIDPYPRAPGVEFAPPEDGEQAPESPFAVLKGLKSGL